jgi:hypothetical protein
VPDRQLLRRDDAFGLVADVEEDLVPVDADDLAADEIAVVEILQRCFDGRGKLFGGQVIGNRLNGALLLTLDVPSAPFPPASAARVEWERATHGGTT